MLSPLGQKLVRGFAPVDRLDVAALRTRPLPPASLGTPRAVRPTLRLEQLQRVGRTRVGEPDGAVEHGQPDEDVVVPVRRVPELEKRRVGGLAGAVGLVDAMLEQELGAALRSVDRAVLGETEDRAPRLVERGVRSLGTEVAVPAAVRPLRLDERLGQRVEAIVAQPEPYAGVESAPVLGRAATRAALDHALVDAAQPL